MLLPTASDVLNDPLLLAVLIVALAAIAALQMALGPGDDWFWNVRRVAWPTLDPAFRRAGRPLITQKGPAEYVESVATDIDTVDRAMDGADYHPNGTATLKYVVINGTRVKESRSWVHYDPEEGKQTHAYLFEWGGAVHAHQHVEAITTRPQAHVGGDEQVPGDPEGRLHAALRGLDPHIDSGYLNALGE